MCNVDGRIYVSFTEQKRRLPTFPVPRVPYRYCLNWSFEAISRWFKFFFTVWIGKSPLCEACHHTVDQRTHQCIGNFIWNQVIWKIGNIYFFSENSIQPCRGEEKHPKCTSHAQPYESGAHGDSDSIDEELVICWIKLPIF